MTIFKIKPYHILKVSIRLLFISYKISFNYIYYFVSSLERPTKNLVWDYYTQDSNLNKAKCNLCSPLLSINDRLTISSLTMHLKLKHPLSCCQKIQTIHHLVLILLMLLQREKKTKSPSRYFIS